MTGAAPRDLLAVTPERIRRALWRSFLRYGVSDDAGAAVHAAMSVVEPVLAARDAEITRLHDALGRDRRPARPRPALAPGRARPDRKGQRGSAPRAVPSRKVLGGSPPRANRARSPLTGQPRRRRAATVP